jgi:8-oxo-dGTP pyrophosphatase MutT (NUDIX family)
VEIDAFLLPHDEIGKFLSALAEEESKWLARLGYRVNEHSVRINALFWVKIRVQLSHLLPPLLGSGAFIVHHATQDYIMLVKGPGAFSSLSNVPLYGTHYTRVECIVLDAAQGQPEARGLVVKEMIGSTECCRKLVTGSVESGEYISQAAEREVMEETGISAKFVGVLGVVNRLCTRFNRDEILVGCLLHASPSGQIPRALSSEIRGAEWIPLSELSCATGNYMAKKWCSAYASLSAAAPAHQALGGQEIPDFRGHGHTMMLYSM